MNGSLISDINKSRGSILRNIKSTLSSSSCIHTHTHNTHTCVSVGNLPIPNGDQEMITIGVSGRCDSIGCIRHERKV